MYSQTIVDFTGAAAELLKKAAPLGEKPFHIDLIINPAAGVFKSTVGMKKAITDLKRFYLETCGVPLPQQEKQTNALFQNLVNGTDSIVTTDSGLGSIRLHVTKSAGHLSETVKLIADDVKSMPDISNILILAGGDGFHNLICTALCRQFPELLNEMIIMRLPMGTGNDSADVPDLYTAARLLINGSSVQKRPVIEISPSGLPKSYSFNIASFGLDAFVCIITEKTKRLFPGNIYRSITDLIVPFYELFYPLKPIKVTITGPEGAVTIREKKMLLTVMGAEGHSNYGGGLPVLPEKANICLADSMNLLEKLKAKKLLYKGEHDTMDKVEFHSGVSMKVEYPGAIPMELDGEVLRLGSDNFPLGMRILPNLLNVIRYFPETPRAD